jgi:hypothetical protein
MLMIAILLAMSETLAFAQDTNPIAPPPVQDVQMMEIPPSAPHVNDYGYVIVPGWNLGMTADVLGVYDTNPAFLLQPIGDVAQRYSGSASVSYLAKHTVYQAAYLPSFSYYRKFTTLNSDEQSLNQTFWHESSPRTNFSWRLNAHEYPSWGGSSFASSAFGSLLMELSGLTALNLESKVKSATTGLTLVHELNRRSHFQADISGGVTKYVHSNSDQFVSLLTAPDSSTWSAQTSFFYYRQLSAHRSLGAGVSAAYFLFTFQDSRLMVQSAMLRYSEVLRKNWAYSVSIGPDLREDQHSSKKIQPGLNLDVDLVHKTKKTAFRASVVNAYQTGAAEGNLTSWVALVSFERSVGKRGFAGVFATYLRSESEFSQGALGKGTTQSMTPAVDGGIRLTRHLVWFANYGFGLQEGALTLQNKIYRQQFLSGISFNVDRLLPR